MLSENFTSEHLAIMDHLNEDIPTRQPQPQLQSSSTSTFFKCISILAQKQTEVNSTKQKERKLFLNLREVDKMPNGSKAEFTRYSRDPFLIFFSQVAMAKGVLLKVLNH